MDTTTRITTVSTGTRTRRASRPTRFTRVRDERGVVVVEFAIVVPVLLLIVFGIFAFGVFLNDTIDEQQLASEAARYAAVNSNPGSPTTLQTYIQQQGSSDVKSNGHVYLYYPTGSTGAAGQSVRACVTATFTALPLIPWLSTGNVTQTATMRVEQTRSNWTVDSSVPSQCPTS
jgi:Flp pilus assembly protein TadG